MTDLCFLFDGMIYMSLKEGLRSPYRWVERVIVFCANKDTQSTNATIVLSCPTIYSSVTYLL